jgi:hypothetical protein
LFFLDYKNLLEAISTNLYISIFKQSKIEPTLAPTSTKNALCAWIILDDTASICLKLFVDELWKRLNLQYFTWVIMQLTYSLLYIYIYIYIYILITVLITLIWLWLFVLYIVITNIYIDHAEWNRCSLFGIEILPTLLRI